MTTVLYLTSVVLTLLFIADAALSMMGAYHQTGLRPNMDILLAGLLLFLVAKAIEQ